MRQSLGGAGGRDSPVCVTPMLMSDAHIDGDGANEQRLHIPGRDPNPKASVEKMIKLGWSLTGIVLTGSIFAGVLKASGYLNWPANPYQWLRAIAVAVSVVNIGLWMWF